MTAFLYGAFQLLWLPALLAVVLAFGVGYAYTQLKDAGARFSGRPPLTQDSPLSEGLRWALLAALAAGSITVLTSFYLALGAMSPV